MNGAAIMQGLFHCSIAFSASSTKSVFGELETRQPTILSAKVSMIKSTQTNPCQVETSVKSLTYGMFGAGARNFRFTLSFGHGWPLSGTVVFFTFPRITPWIARRFINLATVQRAIVNVSRCH